jgi:hypothetical protein
MRAAYLFMLWAGRLAVFCFRMWFSSADCSSQLNGIRCGYRSRPVYRHCITAGHTIPASNSRSPETLSDFVADLGRSAIAGTRQQGVECDIVILTTNWVNLPEALKGIDWRGRILIDAMKRADRS